MKIEVDGETLLKLFDEYGDWAVARTSASWSGFLRIRFPEAFIPEKHPAIRQMDHLELWAKVINSHGLAQDIRVLRSYFNDDGTLKSQGRA